MANMSSQLYGSTVTALLEELIDRDGVSRPQAETRPVGSVPGGDGVSSPHVSKGSVGEDATQPNTRLAVDLENEVIRGAIVLHNGKMMWPPPMPAAPPEPGVPMKSPASVAVAKAASHGSDDGGGMNPLVLVIAGIALFGLGFVAPESKLSHFTVFMLACFVGYQVVWNVKPALHTPLMSVTNAISGIILVGGMLQLSGNLTLTTILGAVAVLIATINIVGGFMVTNRMLAMFRK
jgi:NAD(P) transhydrogenase subunit alpha